MSGRLSRRKSSTNARDYLSSSSSVKIVLLGMKGVGKSAITVRLLTRRYIGEYDPNLETCSKYITKINGEEVVSEIKDTAQKFDEEKVITAAHWADCIVLVYSLVDIDSFREISRIKRTIDKKGQCDLKPIVILANKTDLSEARGISPINGAQYANDVGCPYHEISARESYVDVERVFHTIIDTTLRCSLIKDQINKLCVPTTPQQREHRERRPSLKSIVKNLTRQKTHKEDLVVAERLQVTEKKDSTPLSVRDRSSTCTF